VLPSILEQIESLADVQATAAPDGGTPAHTPASHSSALRADFCSCYHQMHLVVYYSRAIATLHLHCIELNARPANAAAAHHQHAWRPLSHTGTTAGGYTQSRSASQCSRQCSSVLVCLRHSCRNFYLGQKYRAHQLRREYVRSCAVFASVTTLQFVAAFPASCLPFEVCRYLLAGTDIGDPSVLSKQR
jgi:hypothetical protein